jgi:hypothetical protein
LLAARPSRTKSARTPSTRTTALVALAIGAAAAGGLAGCAAEQATGGGAEPSATVETALETAPEPGEACVDWMRFGTPAEAAADAGAVLRGTVIERDGSARAYGAEASRWLVQVEEVL